MELQVGKYYVIVFFEILYELENTCMYFHIT